MEPRRWTLVFLLSLSIQVMLILFPGIYQPANAQEMSGEGYCSMYGICGQRTDGKVLNCPNRTHSVKPDDLLSSKIQSLCPTITGNVCCSADQFDVLRGQVQQAIPLLVSCPACLRNFLNLFCELSCSPDQGLFINVTSVKKVGLCIALAFTFPIMMHPINEIVETRLKSNKWFQNLSYNTRAAEWFGLHLSRILVLVLLSLLASFVPSFGNFVSFVGSTVCALLSFVLPAMFHLTFLGSEMKLWQRILDYGILLIGTAFAAHGTYDAISGHSSK